MTTDTPARTEAATPRRTGSIGALLPLTHDLYFSGMLAGILEGSYEHDVQLVVAQTLHEHNREVALRRRLAETTDGVLLVLPEESNDDLIAAAASGPMVVLDPLLPLESGVSTVTVANSEGATDAVDHLLALGHRRIAAITGPPGWVATDTRLAAYHVALERAGVPLDPGLVLHSDFEIEAGAEAAAALLALPDPPTAVFAFNDPIAAGSIRAARARGLQVPDDLSVVGFDDIPLATAVTPALTTVRQPLQEMGRAAMTLLLRVVEGRTDLPHVELPTRLVVRGSTAPPPSRG